MTEFAMRLITPLGYSRHVSPLFFLLSRAYARIAFRRPLFGLSGAETSRKSFFSLFPRCLDDHRTLPSHILALLPFPRTGSLPPPSLRVTFRTHSPSRVTQAAIAVREGSAVIKRRLWQVRATHRAAGARLVPPATGVEPRRRARSESATSRDRRVTDLWNRQRFSISLRSTLVLPIDSPKRGALSRRLSPLERPSGLLLSAITAMSLAGTVRFPIRRRIERRR